MAAARRPLDEAFIQAMRERIEVVKIIDALQDHVLHNAEMSKTQVHAGLALLGFRLPKLAQIEGGNVTDNSVTIQVLQFGGNTDPRALAAPALPASPVALPGERREAG